MAAVPHPQRRRPRRGSVDRPINARTYRGTWLLVGIPLLVAAFSVSQPPALPRANLPPAFDGSRALGLAKDLAGTYPDRRPGTLGATGAVEWLRARLREEGFEPQSDRFAATIPDRGRVHLVNVTASVPGRSPDAIVVLAHRDDIGAGPGADDNASGTAALLELARAYSAPPTQSGLTPRQRVQRPAHTLIFASTDGGAYGWAGARHFLDHQVDPGRLVAVIDLDAIGGSATPGVQLAGDRPRSAPAALVKTAAARVEAQSGTPARAPTVLAQLIDLAFPFNYYEHALFVGRGIPAITLTTAGDRPPNPSEDTPRRLDRPTLRQVGRSTSGLISSIDQAAEVTRGTSSYLFFGSRIIPGWAVELVLIAALLPFLVATVDLFARCRRRRIPLRPAFQSYRSRLLFWLWIGGLFALFSLTGVFGTNGGGPIPPDVPGAADWPVLGLAGLCALGAIGWLVARDRLFPRRPIAPEEELAGSIVALLALAVVALVVTAVNPFALLFVLPSLHAWLWLPQVRHARVWIRAAILLAGFAGVALLLASFAIRFGLGLDAVWYIGQLVADGNVSIALLLSFLAWLAAAGQLAAVSGGRYAPYPRASERPRRGPIRETVRRLILGVQRHERPEPVRRRAAQ
jgi:Peptidase family M28